MLHRGDPIHGEVSSADASSGVAAAIYVAGSVAAYTLPSTQYIEITDLQFSSTAGGAYAFVADTDAAGRRIIKGNSAATGGLTLRYSVPRVCPRGVVPKLIADAGQVDLVFTGYLVEV